MYRLVASEAVLLETDSFVADPDIWRADIMINIGFSKDDSRLWANS